MVKLLSKKKSDSLSLVHRTALWLLRLIPPRIYARLRRGRTGAASRKLLDMVLPRGSRTVAEVRAGRLKGARFELDPRSQKEMILGTYESAVQEVVAGHAGPGDVVFDIGAHLGFLTMLASRLVGESGRVVALEPDPFMAQRLAQNIGLNGATNVTCVTAAAGQGRSSGRFVPGRGGGTGRLSSEGSMDVEMVTVDDLAATWGVPRLMKIDVEGAELEVLKGAGGVLEKHHPAILVEIHGPENEKAVTEMLSALQYSAGFLDDASGRTHLLATFA